MVGTGDGPVDDGTAGTEVDGRLACGSALGLEFVVPIVPGVAGVPLVDTSDPGQQRRLGPLSGAKPHQSSLEMPTPLTPGPGSAPLKAGTKPVTDRFVEAPSMPIPGHGSPPPRAGIQPAIVQFVETPTMPTSRLVSPPPKARAQPVNDQFIEIPPRAGTIR